MPLPIRLVVGHQSLELGAQVRILYRQPTPSLNIHRRIVARSSSGPGHGPLKAETGVRLPYGLPRHATGERHWFALACSGLW